MAVTDSVILGAEADGLVMALQARRTQRERVRDAEDLLRQAHVNLLGFVLTDVRSYIPRYLTRYRYYTTYKYVD
jgi:non-specific protein-tyrosine kinase